MAGESDALSGVLVLSFPALYPCAVPVHDPGVCVRQPFTLTPDGTGVPLTPRHQIKLTVVPVTSQTTSVRRQLDLTSHPPYVIAFSKSV